MPVDPLSVCGHGSFVIGCWHCDAARVTEWGPGVSPGPVTDPPLHRDVDDDEFHAEVADDRNWVTPDADPPPEVAVTRDQKARVLVGDLGWLEYAIADYVAKWGTNWTGQPYMGEFGPNLAGMPTAVANMAMTVIRKNLAPLAEAPQPKVLAHGWIRDTGGGVISVLLDRISEEYPRTATWVLVVEAPASPAPTGRSWFQQTVWDALAVLTADGDAATVDALVGYIDDPLCGHTEVGHALWRLQADGVVTAPPDVYRLASPVPEAVVREWAGRAMDGVPSHDLEDVRARFAAPAPEEPTP
jgi:hypothetical protein